jgi:hypothetical protein
LELFLHLLSLIASRRLPGGEIKFDSDLDFLEDPVFCSKRLISFDPQVILGDWSMGYSYSCERCGEVIEADERSKYVDALEKHFRENHPGVDHPETLKQQFI